MNLIQALRTTRKFKRFKCPVHLNTQLDCYFSAWDWPIILLTTFSPYLSKKKSFCKYTVRFLRFSRNKKKCLMWRFLFFHASFFYAFVVTRFHLFFLLNAYGYRAIDQGKMFFSSTFSVKYIFGLIKKSSNIIL